MVDEGLISREEAVARIDPAQLDQLLHPMIDPSAQLEVAATGLNASPGAASGAHRLRLRLGGRAREERPGDPRPLGDDAGRHPRDDRGGGNPHRARRNDLACCGRRARHGEALRRRVRRPHHRREDRDDRGAQARRSRRDHDRRRHRARVHRRGAARAAADQRGLRDDPRLGRRAAAPQGARERRQPGGRGAGARVRCGGDRPLPDRAHVLRRPASGRAGDDPRRHRDGSACGARPAPAVPAVGLRGDLRGDGRAAGDDPAARPAAARVPSA